MDPARLRATPPPSADLLAELAAAINAGAREPGDVDADALMAATGKSKALVRNYLMRRVKAGELVTLMAYDPAQGRRIRVWRRPA